MHSEPHILIFEMCVHLSRIRGIRQHALHLSHDTDVIKLHGLVTVLLFMEIYSLDSRIWKHRFPHLLVHGTKALKWHIAWIEPGLRHSGIQHSGHLSLVILVSRLETHIRKTFQYSVAASI